MDVHIDTEKEVLKRYAEASAAVQSSLCCAVAYDPKYLAALPAEIVDRDYGCGDPSQYVREGDTVLDLGSGSGKVCYIASQIVGPKGRVIGVDFNPPMLALARRHQNEIARRIGWNNVTFKFGKIQDLRTDYDDLARWLNSHPVHDVDGLAALERYRAERGATDPMVADESVDLVVSNCVLNLVRAEDKAPLFAEMHRVLRRGGRLAVSDIVSDEPVPAHLRNDPQLWSGCISGAFEERTFLAAFEDAGFYGIEIAKRDGAPWRVVEGIEFRSITVTARKGKQGPCLERHQAVIYKGPWREVLDDDGHRFERGVATAVCDKTFAIIGGAPYREAVVLLSPRDPVAIESAGPFDGCRSRARDARELKGGTQVGDGKSGGGCC